MVLPVAVAVRVLDAERVVRVERPAAVRDGVGEHLPLDRVVRGEHVVAREAVSLAPRVHERHLRDLRVRRLGAPFPDVLHPAPVGEGDAHELVARALGVVRVVEPSAMLDPP